MKRITVRTMTTVRQVGNRITVNSRVSNGKRTRTFTKSVRLPK